MSGWETDSGQSENLELMKEVEFVLDLNEQRFSMPHL